MPYLLFNCFMIFAVVVVSKTFTTAETMLNARTLREWISAALGLVLCNEFFSYMELVLQGFYIFYFYNWITRFGFKTVIKSKSLLNLEFGQIKNEDCCPFRNKNGSCCIMASFTILEIVLLLFFPKKISSCHVVQNLQAWN